MDFLSDSMKKERRNLLATGFAGIIVAQLELYPTEIDLVGIKFSSPELPWIAVGALTIAITYSWLKFLLSVVYETFHTKTENLLTQIRNDEIEMDVSKKEQELKDWTLQLIEQRKVLQGQIEHEKKRLDQVEEGFRNDTGNAKKSFEYLESLAELDAERIKLAQKLADIQEILKEEPGNLLQKLQFEITRGELHALEKREKEPELKIASELKAKLEDLEKERKRIKRMQEGQECEIRKTKKSLSRDISKSQNGRNRTRQRKCYHPSIVSSNYISLYLSD